MKHFSLLRRLLPVFLLLISSSLWAQTNWNLAMPTDGSGSAGAETGKGICTDAAGNVYIVGVYSNGGVGNTDFNLAAGPTANAPTTSFNQGFVASYDKNGTYRWHTLIVGTAANFSSPSGAICTNGTSVWFTGAVNYGGSPQVVSLANTVTIPLNSGGAGVEIMVGKLACNNGSVQWAREFGGTSGNDLGQGICIDPNGCCYVTGSYGTTSPFTVDGLTFPVTNGTSDLFIAKFSANGTMIRRTIGGSTTGPDMISNGGSMCYVPGAPPAIVMGGSFGTGTATFGSFNLVNTGASSHDALLLEMDTLLNITNAIGAGTGAATADEFLGVVYDPFSGGVYCAGMYNGGSITLPGAGTLTNAGVQDIMIARYSVANNNFNWAVRAGGTGDDRALAIAADGQGGILVSGLTASAPCTFGSISVSTQGINDLWVAHYTTTGTPLWVRATGSALGDEQARGVASYVETTPSLVQHVYTTGNFQETVTFNTTTLVSDGGNDFFLARINDLSLPLAATQSQVNLTCNGVCNGSATVVASGGVPPYSYSWSPSGGSGATASSLCATNFTVTITDAASTSITKTFSITQPPAISITPVSQNNVTCNGGNNGTAQVTASGGTGTLTYNWSPAPGAGQGTGSVTGLTAAVYTVTVTDANSCTATRTFNITQPSTGVSGTTAITNVSCFGGSNGAIDLTPTGGNPGYTYLWLPSGPTTEDRSNVTAGTYTVRITDASGCTGTVTATVTQPTAPVSGTTVVTNVSCFGGNNGAIDLTPTGGSPGYTYLWLPSGPTTEDRSGLVAGTYSVQITDTRGCMGTVTVQVTQPTAPVSGTTVVTNVSCFGGNNGAIDLTPTGGTGPYTYLWLPSGPTTEDRSALVAGTYSVQITDTRGCMGTVTVQVTQPTAPVSGTTIVTNVACFGGNTGAIDLTPTGGTGPYTYLWLPSGPTTEDRSGLTAGTFSVQITDTRGCTGTVTAQVTQPASPVSGTTIVTNVACFGGNTGAIDLTPTGGTGPYTYLWLPSGPTTEDRSGLTAGTFSVQITDTRGCTGTVTAQVTQPASPVSGTTVVTNVSCFGGNNGAIDLTPTGGTGPYTYLWLPSGPTTEDRSALVAGTYSVQITDTRGCTGTVTAQVTQPAAPVSGTTVITNVSCFGGNNGAIDLTPTGGVGPYTYLWLPSGPTTEDRSGLTAGTYSVQITDTRGCTGTVTTQVTQPAAPVSGTTVVTNVSCFGGNNGAIDLTPTGGVGPYTYLWLPSGPTTEDRSGLTAGTFSVQITDTRGCTGTVTTQVTQPASPVSGTTVVTNVSCFGGNNGAIDLTPAGGVGPYTYLWLPSGPTTEDRSALTAGTYSVQITDTRGCTVTVTASVTQPASAVSGTTVVTNVSCFGGNNGAIDLTPTGGTGPYTYLWLPSGPTTEDRSALTAGTYSVQITDTRGCTGTVTTTVTQPGAPVSGTTVVTNVSCFGGNNGAIDLTPTGGVGPYTYLWLPSGPTTEDRSALVSGTYSVQITDTRGCTGTVTATVTQPSAPVSGTTIVTNVACFGGNTGAINLTPTGGTGPYTYLWLPSGPTTEDRSALTAGTYSVQITDTRGCTGTVTANVTQPPTAVSGTTVVTNVACFGGNTGAIDLTPTGGIGPYTFQWASGPTTEDRSNLTAGNYTVVITDANTCTATVTVQVTQPPTGVSGTTIVTNVSCNGGNNGAINLTPAGGVGPYTFQWASGPTTEDRTNLTAGNYTVVITDANTCTATVTVQVTQPPVLTVTITSTNISCNGGNNGSMTANPSGGTPGYTFSWMPSGNTQTLNNLAAGCYTVIVTDVNGCTALATNCITQPAALVATSTVTNVSCSGGNNGSIAVNVTGGTGQLTYAWTPNVGNTATVSNLSQGSYTVLITDANGCTRTHSATVTQPTAVTSVNTHTNVTCFGANNGSASVTASGGVGGYTYTWSPNVSSSNTASGLSPALYTVVITDANGCSATATFNVTQPTALAVSAMQTNVSCNGGNNGDAMVMVTGGTPNYTYAWAPSGGNAATATGLSANMYTVTITDANSCTATQTFSITEPNAITATVSPSGVTCNGDTTGSATVNATGGTGAYTYLWSPSGGTNATAIDLAAGTYTVSITDANGCTGSATVNITEPAAFTSSVTVTDVTCNGGNDGAIDITVNGGTPSYNFDWNNGAYTTEDLSGIPAGTYVLMLTDYHGCMYTETVTVNEPAPIAPNAVVTDATDCLANDGMIDLSPTGGNMPYSFLWSNTQTTEDISGLDGGVYSVTITDAMGCTHSATFTITEPGAPVVTYSEPVDSACVNTTAPFLLSGASPAGGTWSGPGVSGNMFDPQTANLGMNVIVYTYTDISGCSGTAMDSIFVDVCMGVPSVALNEVSLYPNPTDGVITISGSAGQMNIFVYDAFGKLLISQQSNTNRTEINLGEYSNGIYFVTVEVNGARSTSRIILSH